MPSFLRNIFPKMQLFLCSLSEFRGTIFAILPRYFLEPPPCYSFLNTPSNFPGFLTAPETLYAPDNFKAHFCENRREKNASGGFLFSFEYGILKIE